MQLTPDTLRTFVATTRTRNFTHTARQMNLTQSAVSMQINRLEEGLGKKLFHRITRGVELTPDGEKLLKYARHILRLHDEAVASLTRPEMDGVIRLGAAEDYASQHLPSILRRFRAKYPLARVDLYCDLSDNLLKMLTKKELDLCLCNSEHGERGGQFLRHEPVVWIAPADAEPENESPLPLALFHQGCLFRKWALQALSEQGVPYRIAYSSPSISGIIAAVKAGFAVAPIGASIPVSGFRVIPEGVLPHLASATISLHQSDNMENTALAYLATHITKEFRAMPLGAFYPDSLNPNY